MSDDPRIREFANNFVGETVQALTIDGFSEDDPGPAWSPNDNSPRPAPTPIPQAPVIPVQHEWPEPSPLIPKGPPTTIPQVNADDLQIPEIEMAVHELWVGDGDAEYRGQAVTLSPQEKAAIASIVLRAIARRVQGQMKEVSGVLPRRVRVPRTAPVASVPKKRGRPKGSKNKPAIEKL